MKTVVRKGQKTWYGRTKQETLDRAAELRTQAKNYIGSAAGELASRDREEAAWLEHNAKLMSD